MSKTTVVKELDEKLTQMSVAVSVSEQSAVTDDVVSEHEEKAKTVVVAELAKNDTQRKDKKKVIEENEVPPNKIDKKNKTNNVKEDSKSQDDGSSSFNEKDSIKQKGRATIKSTKTLKSDPSDKKKGTTTSKKKVRGVRDQELPEKKQTSLTDHFQVRRSERKLKTLGEDEARMALEKQVLSGIEDGLEVKVLEDKGRGIFASQNFLKGFFVCEYAGELIDYQEAKERESDYGKDPEIGSYMYFFQYKDRKYCVDATKETSRLGRLVNHSKTSNNVHTKLLPINDVPHLILVASQDIVSGEELLYDYGDRSKQAVDNHPWLKS